jgi:ATP-dependent Lon protease
MFVNNSTGRRGLVCQYDVICFDEIGGISFDQKDGVNIMKGYMESGEFSRGKESIRADGSLVLVGNFEVDVEHQQRVGHLFGPLPQELRDDTAFMDRIHAFLPGWDISKVSKELLTNHFGLVGDFWSECMRCLRNQSRVSALHNRVYFGGALSGRDTNAVNKTASGLLKLLYPGDDSFVPDEEVEWAVRIAIESRRRVKEQQKRIGAAEFRNTHFSYVIGDDGVEKFVATPELQNENSIGSDPLEPGQVWTISPGGTDDHPGLYRIEVNEGPGSGVKIINKPVPPAFKESVGFAEQNLYARALNLVGDKFPRQHEFTVQLRAFDTSKSGAKIGVAALVALCTALLKKSVRGGLIIVGEINLGGSIEPVHNMVGLAEIAVEKGASGLLAPVSCRKQLFDLSDDMATKIDVQFYSDAKDALLKAMLD